MRKFFTQSSVLGPQSFFFLAILALYVLAGVALVPFHGDEATQIYMSRDYAYQFIQRDLDLVRYQDDPPLPEQQALRLINGSLIKYGIGLAWHLGGYTLDDINEQWDWGGDWEYNTSTGHAPSPGLLLVSRWPSALLLAGSVVLLFVLGWHIGGRPVAWLASLVYALNPAVLLNGRRAMMEGALLFFALLVVLAGIYYLRRPSWRAALLLGVSAGLALAAKHTNLFAVGAVFAACALYPLIARQNLWRSVLYLVCAALAGAFVFWLANPVWWGANPLEHLSLILQARSDLLNGQVGAFGGYTGLPDQLAGFARQALIVYPQYFEVAQFGPWIADQITGYEASPWRGVSLGGSAIGAGIMLVLVVVGAWAFARGRDIPLPVRCVVGLWALVVVASTLLLTPLEWQRYYLPVFPALSLFAALGVVRLVRFVKLS